MAHPPDRPAVQAAIPHRMVVRLTCVLVAAMLSLSAIAAASIEHVQAATPAAAAKRGIASVVYLRSAPDKLRFAGASWAYSWNTWVPYSTTGLESVPMIRDSRGTTDAIVRRLRDGRLAGGYRHLLGFNEPDHANQANLTPTQAANLWPKLMATGLTLGSPAPALPTDGWLKQFMALVAKRKLRVDFIALHFYANITDRLAVQRIKTQIAMIRQHYGKPIWVTELGIIDTRQNQGSALANTAAAQKFMRSVTAMLDALPYVQRYAWMGDNVYARQHLHWSSLYDSKNRLTQLGVTYKNLN
ncbi:MAG TPA: glycosyl hydrolase [Jatrophihabitans sp.]|nr:glycosyl hydrolase [Jatrophihabitans sp.]